MAKLYNKYSAFSLDPLYFSYVPSFFREAHRIFPLLYASLERSPSSGGRAHIIFHFLPLFLSDQSKAMFATIFCYVRGIFKALSVVFHLTSPLFLSSFPKPHFFSSFYFGPCANREISPHTHSQPYNTHAHYFFPLLSRKALRVLFCVWRFIGCSYLRAEGSAEEGHGLHGEPQGERAAIIACPQR